MKTDERVKQDVVAELNWDLAVDAGKICVAVQQGVVTLTGHVSSYAEKWDAERAAQRISRAKVVAAATAVDLTASDQRGDVDIEHSAESMLQCATYLSIDCAKVVVENACIAVSREVDHTDPCPSAPVNASDQANQGDARGCNPSGLRKVINRITVE